MTAMKWGIICSIPDPSTGLMDELKNFGEWLIDELEAHSHRFYLYHDFAEKPAFCYYCTPGDKEAIYVNYEKVHRNHADVLYILHILPEKNSLEFRLMKELTLNYALIGQGVLLENALSKFADLELDLALAKMNQYIMRRMSQLITFQRAENTFHLTVGNKENGEKSKLAHNRLNDICMVSCVDAVLHSTKEVCAASILNESLESVNVEKLVVFCDSPETLIVEGFPASFNKFQVASFFPHPAFRPVSVFINTNGRAFVEFANKFHALQAALYYIRDAAAVAANAELGIHLKLRCADVIQQKCLKRRIAKSVAVSPTKAEQMNESMLTSPASFK